MAETGQQQQDPFAISSVTPIDPSASIKATATAPQAPTTPAAAPAAPAAPQTAGNPHAIVSVTKIGTAAQTGVPASVKAIQPPQVTQRRYTAPGQGVQEFTAGSTDEQAFLQKFPNAKMIPQTYQRNVQPAERQGQKNEPVLGGVLGHVDTESEALNTEPPSARSARQSAQAHEAIRKAATLGLSTAGAVVAPELLPFLGVTGTAAGVGGTGYAATVLAPALAEATGAGLGTATGQAVTGENPFTKENAEESLKNAAIFGGTRGVLGSGGVLLGKVADWVRGVSKLPPDLEQAAQQAISQAGGGEDQLQTVTKAKADLDKAETEMHQNYETKFNQISKAANDAKVPVNIKDSELQHTAQSLLNDSRVPGNVQDALRKVTPDASRLEPLLREFAGVDEAGNPIKGWNPRQTWDQTEATRQAIGKAARELPYGDPLKYPLLKLRDAIDATLEQSATDAGMPELSRDIKNLRGQYAEKINLFQNNAIEQLRDKDPNAVAAILTSGRQSIQNVKDMRSLIGPENMKQVEGSVLAQLVQKARNIDGSFNAQKLLNSFNNLGPDVRQAIWGDNLPEVEQFFKDAVKPNIKGNTIQQIFGRLSHISLAGRTGAGAMGGLIFGLVHGESPTDVLRDMAVLGVAGAAPEIAARYGPRIADAADTAATVLGVPRTAETTIPAVAETPTATGADLIARSRPGGHVPGTQYTDEGLRSTFAIPYSMPLSDLVDKGVVSKSGGFYTVNEPGVAASAAAPATAIPASEATGKGIETIHTGTPDTMNTIKLRKDGEDIGQVVFTHDGSTASVGHSWVDSSVRGQGHGQTLLTEAAKKARLQGAKILTSDPEGEMTAAARKPWEALKQKGLPVTNTTINGKPGYEMDLSLIDADGKPIPPETDKVPTTKDGVKATTDFGKTAKTPSQSNTTASKTAAVAASQVSSSESEQKKPANAGGMKIVSQTPLNPQAAGEEPQAKLGEEVPERSVAELKEVVRNAAESHEVPPDLLDAQAEQESKYDPKARSHKGAQGLMQFMPATARAMGVVNPDDPEESADRGAELMASLKKRFGTWDKALAGYNSNPDKVQDAIDDYGDEWLYHLPEETQNYVHTVMRKFALAKTAHVPRMPGEEAQ